MKALRMIIPLTNSIATVIKKRIKSLITFDEVGGGGPTPRRVEREPLLRVHRRRGGLDHRGDCGGKGPHHGDLGRQGDPEGGAGDEGEPPRRDAPSDHAADELRRVLGGGAALGDGGGGGVVDLREAAAAGAVGAAAERGEEEEEDGEGWGF